MRSKMPAIVLQHRRKHRDGWLSELFDRHSPAMNGRDSEFFS